MAHIHVFFPRSGGTFVANDPKAVIWNERIHWHFHRMNKKIKKVRVEFNTRNSDFFPSPNGPQSWIEKALKTDETSLYGEAPPEKKRGKKKAAPHAKKKYTIYGYAASGKQVTKLDPTIITTDPG
jgi:hypothetical protein